MSGWEDQLTGLVSARGDALARFGYLLAGDDQEAVDLVQEALVRVLACPFHEIGGDTRFEMARVPVLSGKLGLATVQGSLSRKALCG